ncbi:family 20 glycosylhydrolase [Bacteroides uniformis]|nr:family 20 glycosylhydrolase [Bacteroides uniformis]
MDVSRHFFNTDYVKKQIDLVATYKINRLHWHLTDGAGWRLEIPGYPRPDRIRSLEKSRQSAGLGEI